MNMPAYVVEDGKLKVALSVIACEAALLDAVEIKTSDGLKIVVKAYSANQSAKKRTIANSNLVAKCAADKRNKCFFIR